MKQWTGVILAGLLFATASRAEGPSAQHCLNVGTRLLEEVNLVEHRSVSKHLLEHAVELLLRAAEEGNAQITEQALCRAAECYVEMGDNKSIASALVLCMMVLERFPGGGRATDAILLKGRIYADLREWDRAIAEWQRLAEEHPEAKAAPEALFRCARVFEEKVRNETEAMETYTGVLQKYPESDVAPGSLMARARLRADADAFAEAAEDYLLLVERYGESEHTDEAMYEALSIYEGDLKDYKKAYELAVRFKEKFPHSPYLTRVERIESRTLRYVSE